MKIHKLAEPKITLPAGVGTLNPSPVELSKFLVCLPVPNTTDDFLYLTVEDLAKLLKANKHRPEAIQYIADMVGNE